MNCRTKYFIVFIVILIINISLLTTGPIGAPKKGTSAAFWYYACKVNIGYQHTGTIGGFHQQIDGFYFYYIQGFHGRFLYKVHANIVSKDFPKVVHEIKSLNGRITITPYQKSVYQAWLQSNGNIDTLLANIHRLTFVSKRDKEDEQFFEKRWKNSYNHIKKWLFEFLFLATLVIFTTWPWIQNLPPKYWSLHIGLFPILLFFPYFLGYAAGTLTSIGPTGGIWYPYLIGWMWGWPFMTSLDDYILDFMPQILYHLSMDYNDPNKALFIGHIGKSVGPVTFLLMGVILGGLVYFWRKDKFDFLKKIPMLTKLALLTLGIFLWQY